MCVLVVSPDVVLVIQNLPNIVIPLPKGKQKTVLLWDVALYIFKSSTLRTITLIHSTWLLSPTTPDFQTFLRKLLEVRKPVLLRAGQHLDFRASQHFESRCWTPTRPGSWKPSAIGRHGHSMIDQTMWLWSWVAPSTTTESLVSLVSSHKMTIWMMTLHFSKAASPNCPSSPRCFTGIKDSAADANSVARRCPGSVSSCLHWAPGVARWWWTGPRHRTSPAQRTRCRFVN